MGATLGHNLAVLGLIFDCILPLVPFPFLSGGNISISLFPF